MASVDDNGVHRGGIIAMAALNHPHPLVWREQDPEGYKNAFIAKYNALLKEFSLRAPWDVLLLFESKHDPGFSGRLVVRR